VFKLVFIAVFCLLLGGVFDKLAALLKGKPTVMIRTTTNHKLYPTKLVNLVFRIEYYSPL
jgi:hypothetical protein